MTEKVVEGSECEFAACTFLVISMLVALRQLYETM